MSLQYVSIFFFLLWLCNPTRVMAFSFLGFLDHTQRCTTVGRTFYYFIYLFIFSILFLLYYFIIIIINNNIAKRFVIILLNFSGRVISSFRDLYLTTHNIYNRQTSMPQVEIELTISKGERPQTYALDRATTGTGNIYQCSSF